MKFFPLIFRIFLAVSLLTLFLVNNHYHTYAATSADLVPSLSLTQDFKKAEFTVKNTGNTPVKLTTNNFQIEYGWKNSQTGSVLWKSTVKISDANGWWFWESERTLRKGDSGLSFTRDLLIPPNGASQFYVNVDSSGQIAEGNENNNIGKLTYMVADLIPVLKLSPDKTIAEFSIINTGGLPVQLTTSNFLVEYGWRVRGGEAKWKQSAKINESEWWPFWQSETVLIPGDRVGLRFRKNVTPTSSDATEFYVKADSEGQIIEREESNNEVKENFDFLPDLQGTVDRIEGSSEFTFLVTNAHTAPVTLTANNFLLEYGLLRDIDGKSVWNSTLTLRDADGSGSYGNGKSLVAGDAITFHRVFPIASLEAGVYRPYIKVDSGNQIAEANENNNVATYWGHLIKPNSYGTSDLIIESIKLDRAQRIPTIVIKNVGRSDADLGDSVDSYVVLLGWWYKDRNPLGDPKYFPIDNIRGNNNRYLTPGQSISVVGPARPTLLAPYTLKVIVDPTNKVLELNEYNNEKTENYPKVDSVNLKRDRPSTPSATTTPLPVTQELPDLVLGSLVFKNQNAVFSIKNEGDTAFEGNVTISYGFLYSDGEEKTRQIGSEQIFLAKGQSLAKEFMTEDPTDSIRLRVTASTGIVEKTTENNFTDLFLTTDLTGDDLAEVDDKVIVGDIKESTPSGRPSVPEGPLPGELPYIFVDLGRKVQVILTFDPQKKGLLYNKLANEKILEVNRLMDRGKTGLASDHLRSYESDVASETKLIRELSVKNPEIAEKMAAIALEDQLRHQLLFNKFERVAPKDKVDQVKNVQTKALDHMNAYTGFIKNEEIVKEAVSSAIDRNGTAFKALRNAEVLERFEQIFSGSTKDVISKEKEEEVLYFKDSFERLPKEQKRLFPAYAETIGTSNPEFKKVIEELNIESELSPSQLGLPQGLNIPEFSNFDEYLKWLESYFQSNEFQQLLKSVEQFSEPAPSADEASPDTSYPTPQSEDTCPYTDDPVCGNDEYTYNNECEAKQYSVEIAHKGECEQDYQEDQ